MAHRQILHIYDGGDVFVDLPGADENYGIIVPVRVYHILDRLLALGNTYSHLVITAHGQPGYIRLGADRIDWSTNYLDKYKALFPAGGTVYVRGCNCGEGENGLRLMMKLGNLLWIAGGLVIAHVSSGFYIDDTVAGVLSIATGGQRLFESLRNRAAFGAGTKRIVTMTGGGGYLGWSTQAWSIDTELS